MLITSGTEIGAYEIQSPIGAGGMGQVYKARDRKLKRDVAIKVLPEEFSRDPERVFRFQREAEALAAPQSFQHRRHLRCAGSQRHPVPCTGAR